jgi:hypothetical protein
MPDSNINKKKWRTILRKMGYNKDQKGIINRYLRESEGWKEHLQNTRNFILQSAKTKEKTHAVILGSGWLLDVPLEELCESFGKVTLIDIRHPRQVKKKAEKYSNLKLEEVDLTGGLVSKIYESIQAYKKEKNIPLLSSLRPDQNPLKNKPDFIVSCNLLTQLGTLIREYLKKYPEFSDKELNALEKVIQESHIEMLQQGKSCLVSEYEEELYDEDDNFLGTNPLLQINIPEDSIQKRWKWKFDSKMYYRDNMKTYMNVLALEI